MEERDHSHLHIPVIIIGLVIGVVLTFASLYLKNLFLDQDKGQNTQAKLLRLEIEQPGKNLTTSNKTLTISGSTGIAAIVTINNGSNTKTLNAPDSNFSQSVELSEGKNLIQIVSYDPVSGDSRTETREVLYLNEDLTGL